MSVNSMYMPTGANYGSSPMAYPVPDLISSYDDLTTDPSPSPPMMFSSLDAQYQPYLTSPPFPDYTQHHDGSAASQLVNSIDFTDLTQIHGEDSIRRRRRSTTAQDKEAATNMRIRRRAQNRASQRAFRERKEKHVQHLEHELETLESKHSSLERSYSESQGARARLQRECDELREELARLGGGESASSGWGSRESSVGPAIAATTTPQSRKKYKGMDRGAAQPAVFDPFSTSDFFN